MRITIEGLDVFFPYEFMYKEQYEYMLGLKHALDAKGHAVLEMPTGTGKTVCLLALITSYQFAHPEVGKLIYCTRTVPEMVKCMEEVQRVLSYREECVGPQGSKVLAVCLSSRRNMCIHSRVSQEGDRSAVDAQCRSMTASWVRNAANSARESGGGSDVGGGGSSRGPELCSYFENYEAAKDELTIPHGVYSLDRVKAYGQEKGMCPYFVTRQFLQHADIIVYNYQYLLDPKVANLITRDLSDNAIVVFDEAHNIDNVCIEALSVDVNSRHLEASSRCLNKLSRQVSDVKRTNQQRLQDEYSALVNGLINQGVIPVPMPVTASDTGGGGEAPATLVPPPVADAQSLANPVLMADILQEAVPGNIRKAEHFLTFLKKIVEFLKVRMRTATVRKDTPLKFLFDLQDSTGLERKPLRFAYSRLSSLLRTLEISNLEEYSPLMEIANFATLVSTYLEGFLVITEPQGSVVAGVTEPVVQLCCLDSSYALRPVIERFPTVIITSGTLSPMPMYPKLLNFHPVVCESFPMSTFRPCLLPLIVASGADQTHLSTKFDVREDSNVIRNYGQLLLRCASTIPDGICCFFTSYQYLEYTVAKWDEMRIIHQIMNQKLIYIETKDVVETTLALSNYKKACDCGRGAIFLSVSRGKVAEGIDFDRQYGRCVILMGIPYRYTQSHSLLARLQYMRSQYQIHENDFLTFDAMRQAAQCVGRIIRSKTDYGVVVLADKRFNRPDKRSKFPPWITSFIRASCLNLSTDVAVEQIKVFLKVMGQPIDKDSLSTILLTEETIQAKTAAPLLEMEDEVATADEDSEPMEI